MFHPCGLTALGCVLAADTAFLQDFGSSTLHHKNVVHAIVLNLSGAQAATAALAAFLSSCAMHVLGMNSYGFVVTMMKRTTWRGDAADTEAATGLWQLEHCWHEQMFF